MDEDSQAKRGAGGLLSPAAPAPEQLLGGQEEAVVPLAAASGHSQSVPVGPVLEAAACASQAGCIVTVFCDCSFYRKCFCPCVGIFLIALLYLAKVLIDPNYLSS